MVYILLCNSLLILSKPVTAEEICSSLFVLDQHFGGTYRDQKWFQTAPVLMSKNRFSTHNRAHCCSLLGSHTMESEGLLLSWTHGHACFAFEFSRLYSGSILRFCFFWLSSNSVCKYKCLRWLRICLQSRRPRFHPWVRKIPWKKEWLPTPVFLPGRFHGQKSLVGYSPWGHKGQTQLSD